MVLIKERNASADHETSPPRAEAAVVPPPPESLEDAGLSEEFVAGLVLRALHVRGATLGFDLVDLLALPMALLDDAIQHLQDERLVEVHEARGPRRGEYVFKLTGAGRSRAAEEMEVCRYVGPAPVPFELWVEWIDRQSIERARVTRAEVEATMAGVILPDGMLDHLGPAINSGRSLFLYGGPGDGKTLIAERLARVLGDRTFIPYAVLVDGAVMIVHDPALHRGAEDDSPSGVHATGDDGAFDEDILREIVRPNVDWDRRFARTRRPVVVTGGELTLDQLDLQWDPSGRMYQAPPQLKAAGGVLLIDDLGRQRVPVRDLLNRWVVPLEQRRDYLKLRSGRKLVVPFDCFVIFSTNLEPRELADEAFLRRIHYKVEVTGPARDEYEEIFRRCCDEREIPFHDGALDYLFDEVYGGATGIEPRRCHPRDVLDHLTDLAAYRDESPCLSPKALAQACRSYFVAPVTNPSMEDRA